MTIEQLDNIATAVNNLGITAQEAADRLSVLRLRKPSDIMYEAGERVLEGFSQSFDAQAKKLGLNLIDTIQTPDGANCEIIDGYDVVPLSESEYYHYPLGVDWSMDNDKPNGGYCDI